MINVDYSGTDTDDVTFSYTRLGRQKTIDDGVGTRTFNYSEGANGTLALQNEVIVGTNGFYSKTITRDPQGSQAGELPGRDGGFHIGTEYAVTYLYDNEGTGGQLTGTGRFKRIQGPGLPDYGVEYSYLANSNLVEYAQFKSTSATYAEAHRAYLPNRNLVWYVQNEVKPAGGTLGVVSRYEYENDELGRRWAAKHTGAAFSATGDYNTQYAYNGRSELATADRYEGTTLSPPGDHLDTNYAFTYDYDSIGNRLESSRDADDPVQYCAKDTNSYTFAGEGPVDCDEATPNMEDDEDGNLEDDGAYAYTWDAENRLIEVIPNNPGSMFSKKFAYSYDYMGRRVRRQVYTWNSGTSSWGETPSVDYLFVYDGWNVVMLLNNLSLDPQGQPKIIDKYTWGLDLSGSIHGAGGIGGLLAAYRTQQTPQTSDDVPHWYFYDANGNVGQLLHAGTPSSLSLTAGAKYEYDPYGNAIAVGGTAATWNFFRFSTKWFEKDMPVAVLGYWGFRYYYPRLGRWISRDPIGERGDANLYCSIRNDPVGNMDPDGRLTIARVAFLLTNDCGGGEVRWVFRLDQPAPCDGFTVQKVTKLESTCNCDAGACICPITQISLNPNLVFWEAWKVTEGETVSDDTKSDGYTDMTRTPVMDKCCGNRVSLGEVKFFCQTTTGDLDMEWRFSGDVVPQAGVLPSTSKEPVWWNTPAVEGPATRYAGQYWDCSPSAKRRFSDYLAYP